MEIHFASYRNPNQKEGKRSETKLPEGINKTTVAILKIVKIKKKISQILKIH